MNPTSAAVNKFVAAQNRKTLAIGKRKDLTMREKLKALKAQHYNINCETAKLMGGPEYSELKESKRALDPIQSISTSRFDVLSRGAHTYFEIRRNEKEDVVLSSDEEFRRKWICKRSERFAEYLRSLADLQHRITELKNKKRWWHDDKKILAARLKFDQCKVEWERGCPAWDDSHLSEQFAKHLETCDLLAKLHKFLDSGPGKSLRVTIKKEKIKIIESIEFILDSMEGKNSKTLRERI